MTPEICKLNLIFLWHDLGEKNVISWYFWKEMNNEFLQNIKYLDFIVSTLYCTVVLLGFPLVGVTMWLTYWNSTT